MRSNEGHFLSIQRTAKNCQGITTRCSSEFSFFVTLSYPPHRILPAFLPTMKPDCAEYLVRFQGLSHLDISDTAYLDTTDFFQCLTALENLEVLGLNKTKIEEEGLGLILRSAR